MSENKFSTEDPKFEVRESPHEFPDVERLNKRGFYIACSIVVIVIVVGQFVLRTRGPAQKREKTQQPLATAPTDAWYSKKVDTIPELPMPEPAPVVEAKKPPEPDPPVAESTSKRDEANERGMNSDIDGSVGSKPDLAKGSKLASVAEGNKWHDATTPRLSGEHDLSGLLHDGAAGQDQNLQARKEEFLAKAEHDDELPYLMAKVQKPLSPYEVKAGSVIPATMLTSINSDLPGEIQAQVRETVYDTVSGRYALIPQGTRAIGTYDSRVAFGQDRVLVAWRRLIFPNGSSISLKGMPGTDGSGSAGVTGEVNNHYWPMFGSAVLLSVVGAGAQLSQPKGDSGNEDLNAATVALGAALGQNIGDMTTQVIRRYLERQPTITVKPGERINILVTKDMLFDGEYED